jgi:hypothetical protein
MEALDRLVGGEIASAVARSAISGAQARRCRCDRRPGSEDRMDKGAVGLSLVALAAGGLALR